MIEYYNEYEDILNKDKKIKYSIKDGDSTVFVYMDISRFRIILGFNRLNTGDVNYVFINEKLNATGASNPTGNNESLIKMGCRVCDINIAKAFIPEFLLKYVDEIKKVKIIKYNNKKDEL